MTVIEAASLTLAAAAAGAINAVAGGGTLITFPVLLFFGLPPTMANATSTLALVLGNGGSLFGYRRQINSVRVWLRRFVPVSLAGGLIGSLLLTRGGDAVFARLVPFLILFATVLFFSQGAFRRFAGFGGDAGPHTPHHHVRAAIVFQFLVAIYGGYFGAGIGILMLASLGFIGLTDIHEMNSLKTVLGMLINVVAAAWFVWSGLIDWPRAGILTLGALCGYFLGSHFAQRIPQARVRQLITAIGFALSAVTFWKTFR
jgi:uncharacterized protein